MRSPPCGCVFYFVNKYIQPLKEGFLFLFKKIIIILFTQLIIHYFSRKGNDKELIRKSGIILEISESLDLNRKGLVQRVEVESKVDHILFKVYSSYDLRLEIEDAREAADGFESLFGKELKFKLLDV
ncbi:hypothetical protein [Halanaerobium congolense]|uniref:hypothetical protein n=1 Tax=Halanaerobium congolense TaxID=54121 RepID=UPI00122D871E|nr:hypothetical protein [Halanaerobium congolense]